MSSRIAANKCWGHDRPSDESFCSLECVEYYEARQGIQLPAETRQQLLERFGATSTTQPSRIPSPQAPNAPGGSYGFDEDEEIDEAWEVPRAKAVVVEGDNVVVFPMLNGARIVLKVSNQEESDKIMDEYERKEIIWVDLA